MSRPRVLMRRPRAVVFGAGKMSCGLLGPLLCESGYETVFVARRPEVVEAIERHRGYRLTIAGPQVKRVAVRNCTAFSLAAPEAVAHAVASADVVLTGVGIDNVAAIAPLIEQGLWRRSQALRARPVNVVACENLPGAGGYLRHQIVSAAPLEHGLAVETTGGFSAALTRRIMTGGTQAADGELSFAVSGPPDLVVDVTGLKGTFPRIRGVSFTEDFSGVVMHKLYTLNLAQAVAAYLGYRHGCRYVHEAAVHPEVAPAVRGALSEAGAALRAAFPTRTRDIGAQVADALAQISNPGLGDTIRRVARDPRRKLSSLERLVGPARLAARHGLPYDRLSLGIAAALAYDEPADPEAGALQETIASDGIERVLTVDCGLLPHEAVARAVKEQWRRLVAPSLEEALR
jgi:mannitol-1-phosphate 5-dehydrogenase